MQTPGELDYMPRELVRCGLTGMYGGHLCVAGVKDGAPIYVPNEDRAWREFPFMRFQPPWCRNGVLVDLDDADVGSGLDRVRSLGLPDPAWTTEHNGGGQMMWCLAEPVHLATEGRSPGVRVSWSAIRYYDAVRKGLVDALGGDPGGTGFSRQRNPLYRLNRGVLLQDDGRGVQLDVLAGPVGVDRWKLLERREMSVEEKSIRSRVLLDELLEGARSGGRCRGTVSQRLELACADAAFVWPGSRHDFLARRVMRGWYRLALALGNAPKSWMAVLERVNACMPVPFELGESGGLETIVGGLRGSFATDKISGRGYTGKERRRQVGALTAMGRSSANKSKAKVAERNELIYELWESGMSGYEVIDALVERGYPRLSRTVISTVVQRMRPFGQSRKMKRVVVVEHWKRGRSHKEIVERTGVSRHTVVKAILDHIEREKAETGCVVVGPDSSRSGRIGKALEGVELVFDK